MLHGGQHMSVTTALDLCDLRSSFGELGLSGIGREAGEAPLQFRAEPTDVCVQL